MHCRQQIQFHLCITLQHSHIHHGCILLNQLLSVIALEYMIPKSKGCSWLVQLAGRKTTLTLLKNVVVFGWAAH
jgi:hypothetical protein